MLHAARFVWIFTSYSWLAVYRVFETDVGEKWRLSENVRNFAKIRESKINPAKNIVVSPQRTKFCISQTNPEFIN